MVDVCHKNMKTMFFLSYYVFHGSISSLAVNVKLYNLGTRVVIILKFAKIYIVDWFVSIFLTIRTIFHLSILCLFSNRKVHLTLIMS